ncbi:MAG: Lrp/AsnC family transcriptional regulator [Gaiella sp.]
MARTPNDLREGRTPAPLDRIERELVRALQNNARISNKDLAAAVGLAPSTTLERVRRLRERGVIRGFHAIVDLALLGRPTQAMIAVRLRVHHRDEIGAFYDHVLNLPETVALYHVSGPDDYLVHVAVPDTDRLRTFVLDDLTGRPEVDHVETRVIFEYVRTPAIEAV